MFDAQPHPSRYYRPALIFLSLAYLAGLIGLQTPAASALFRMLVPANLLVSAGLLLAFHTDWNRPFLFYCLLALLVGFWVEVLGVKTGFVFGTYAYGPTLGWKWLDVPLIIGVNWLVLTYCCGTLCDRLSFPVYLKAILAASLMVLLDLFIEPVAIQLDFWTWFGADIPIRNYLGWWIVSLILFSFWYGLPFRKQNPLALPLLLLQFLFFVGGCLFNFLS
ncbi:carotenoid biosynthesis protein [Tellurirhabdus rosea]|uniref:carotenoid biosynthesis protein n=1 Tax=Tellurirhabdus rosea TaxID=2674997 RepID=UPI002254C3F0|nr:carotenoid biosynthesis protein [Tellurirhabdus rosea]